MAKHALNKIAVVGMGYVGIPVAALLANQEGLDVTGIQRRSQRSGWKIDVLNAGKSPIEGEEPGLEDLIGRIVQKGSFRADLYHRLNIFPIVLAPLRTSGRIQDVSLLANHFLKSQTICPEKVGRIQSFTKIAIEALEKHDWPGNVRELKNVIERAVLLETTDKIGLHSIVITPENPEAFFEKRTESKIKDYSLAKAEQELIACVLRETNWQKTRAAELLGISRATLYAKVKQHNIPTGPSETSEINTFSEPLLEEEAVA